MVVVSHLFLFYGKISGADVTWYESHLPLFGTIYFPIAPGNPLQSGWRRGLTAIPSEGFRAPGQMKPKLQSARWQSACISMTSGTERYPRIMTAIPYPMIQASHLIACCMALRRYIWGIQNTCTWGWGNADKCRHYHL